MTAAPPPVSWPDLPGTAVDAEAPHLHVYLVVHGHGGIVWSGTDRTAAHQYAQIARGVVGRLPVVGDYRKEEDR